MLSSWQNCLNRRGGRYNGHCCCLKRRTRYRIITDGIYEFRVNYGNNEFRLFFTYDGDTIVILFNCFKKKTQKTPKSEIDKAVRLKNEYYENK